ncbi:hypothetical protein ABEW05_005900 [Botrytis cinerea]
MFTVTTLSIARVLGAKFELRAGNLSEWVEHQNRKGPLKTIGRMGDYIPLSHGDGSYASTLKQEIELHKVVQTVLTREYGQLNPLLLIEPVPGVHGEGFPAELMD